MKPVRVLKKDTHNHPYMKVNEDTLLLEDGTETTWTYLDMQDSVMVVPITKNGKVILVKQYRYTLGKYVYELPSGRVEHGEKQLVAAKRELLEETGYTAKSFVDLGRYYILPNETNKHFTVFLAKDVHKSEKAGLDEEGEQYADISIHTYSLKTILAKLGSESSIVAGAETAFALQLAADYLRN